MFLAFVYITSRDMGAWTLRLLLLFLCVLTVQADKPCTVQDEDNYYDLTPLMSNTDYTFVSPEGFNYTLNVCKPVKSETWAMKVDDPENVGGFTRREHGDLSLGYATTELSIRDGHPALTMQDGSSCPAHSDMHAATTIHFKCDTSVFGAGEPKLIAQLPPPANESCFFFLEWRTHVACPTRLKSGSWGALAILASIAGTLFMVYIVTGVCYNYFILGLRGLDLIPRYSIFTLKDTIQFFRGCIERVRERSGSLHLGSGGMGSWGSRGHGSYRGLAGSSEEEAGMLNGPPGYLDEMDEEDEPQENSSRPAGMDSNGVIRL